MEKSTTTSDPERGAILKALGANIRRLRKAAGLTQGELSKRAGMHINYVSAADRGELNLSAVNLVKLARALGVPPSELLEGME